MYNVVPNKHTGMLINFCCCNVQCGAIITRSIFWNILTIDTPQLTHSGKIWGIFCEYKPDLLNAQVTAMLYEISCYIGIGPCYNNTQVFPDHLMCMGHWVSHQCTLRCHYNVLNFFTNIHKIHPIAHPLGQGMGCLLCDQPLIDILPQFLQLFIQYLNILLYWTAL